MPAYNDNHPANQKRSSALTITAASNGGNRYNKNNGRKVSDRTVITSCTGGENARARLRAALMDHIHSQHDPAPSGYTRWAVTGQDGRMSSSSSSQQDLDVVQDPITLLESIKIFQQYAKLLTQKCHPTAESDSTTTPTTLVYPKNLEWFEHLAMPFRGIDDESRERIDQLLRLHAASSNHCAKTPAKQQAFELAKSLPHFDRDLTAFYLSTPLSNEYELEVAHSILRLNRPDTLADLSKQLSTWRNQGLLHVLSVAVHNMPELADWHLPSCFASESPEQSQQHIRSLLNQLFTSGCKAIERFIASYDPANATDQAFLSLLDRLAILMGVKSNAQEAAEGHCLAKALASFPHLDTLAKTSVANAWSQLKPALESSIPPSVLRIDPVVARKRVKSQEKLHQTVEGSWYASSSLFFFLLFLLQNTKNPAKNEHITSK